jgi:hypothetical protein
MEIKRSLTVSQHYSVSISHGKYVYRVTKLKNLTQPGVGDVLDEGQVKDLIADGVEVTIVERK